MSAAEEYRNKLKSTSQILDMIPSDCCIAGASYNSEPLGIYSRLHEIAGRVRNVRVWTCNTQNEYPFMTDKAYSGSFTVKCIFYGRFERGAHQNGNIIHYPWYLNDAGRNIAASDRPDIYMAEVAPMDPDGYFRIAPSEQYENECFEAARVKIFEVNPNVPFIDDAKKVHISELDAVTECSMPVCVWSPPPFTDVHVRLGENVAELVDDGDTLQLGIGSTSSGIALALKHKKDLGIYTELYSGPMGELKACGAVTNERKNFYPGQTVCAFLWGDQKFYETVSGDRTIKMLPSAYVNDPHVIAQNDRLVSINTCLQVDFSGQIASESIGQRQFSGIGGAANFAQGAYMSKGGKGIIAITSTTAGGKISRIRPVLDSGAVVSIQRNVADYIVTEYGAARLRYLGIRERAEALIGIAHPDFREELRYELKKSGI